MYSFRSNANRIFDRELQVSYDVEKVDYTDSSTTPATTGSWYRVTRHADKTYRYVDLTKAAAGDIASQLRELYTRTTAALDKRASGASVPTVVTFPERLTSVAIERGNGQVYSVVITVQEKDVRASASLPTTPADLFTAENARDYDGETLRDSLSAVSASLS